MSDAEIFDALYRATNRSAAYRDAVAASLAGLPDWLVPFSAVDLALLERLAADLRIGAGDVFLDLACGAGGPGLWIARSTGTRLAGVDFAPAAIGLARALAGRLGLSDRARYDVADVAALPHADNAFDAVSSIDALMFVDAPSAAREIARVLKPGGRFVMTAAESLAEPFLPTLVRDYRPVFESAGFRTLFHGPVPGRDVRSRAFYEAIEARADALRAEIGAEGEMLVAEARGSLERERTGAVRVRDILFVAERLGERACEGANP